MNRGTWLVVEGKKVAAVVGDDGVARPVGERKTPEPKGKSKE